MKSIHLYITLIFCSFFQNSIFATTYYVSNSGNNSNPGTLAMPFLTLQHAADIVIAGDLVLVENGTYAGFDIRNVNGTAANPITFQANGNNVLINSSGPIRDDGINVENADYVIIDGFIVNDMMGNGNGIRVVLSDFCVVKNCSCDNNAERGIFTGFTDDILIENNVCTNSIDEHGIYVSNSGDRPIVRYNECFGNNNIGTHFNGDLSAGGDGIISNAQVYGNHLHDNNLAAGINMDGVENPLIYNNLIYNNHSAQGIALFQQDGAIPTQGAKVFNNTIIVPTDGRWGILMTDGSQNNTEIFNNIIINQHAWRGCIAIENQTNFTSDYNIVNDKLSASGDGSTISFAAWQALGFDANSQIADPISQIFIDPNNDDFHLLSNSQAIDAGTSTVNSIVTVDYENNARPQGLGYDIGAYEFTTALAVEMLDPVRAKFIRDAVWVSWSTSMEISSDYFEVFKSLDGQNWEKIEQVSAKGNSVQKNYYRVKDTKIGFGEMYYQVREIDLEDRKAILGTVSIFIDNQLIINVFPNPTQDYLIIQHDLMPAEIREIQLVDLTGKVVKSYFENIGLVDVSNLEKGTYFLRVLGRNEVLREERIVVQ